MGKVLVLCGGEQERWNAAVPRYVVPVYDELLVERTIRQIRKRMNNYPHIISNLKCLRCYSTNYVVPSAHRWVSESLLSVYPVWGPDWTMILLGDVIYSDQLIDSIYANREKFHYHFYGTAEEIYAVTFNDNKLIRDGLAETTKEAELGKGKGKLIDLYNTLRTSPPEAGHGYSGEEDDLHYTFVLDDTQDFDTIEEYRQWKKKNRIKGTS